MMRRVVYGILAYFPLALWLGMLLLMMSEYDFPSWFPAAWSAATLLYMIGLGLFIWDVWHNSRMPADKRALWTAVLFFAGPLAMPSYFRYYIA